MENIFKVLAQAESTLGQIHDLTGRNVSLALGKIVNTTDPNGWGRVQVALAVHGGKSYTPWYHRMVPLDNCYPPAFLLGRTAVCGYADGDPNSGIVLGVLVNAVNTMASPEPANLNYFVGATDEGLQVTLSPNGTALIKSGITDTDASITMKPDSISLKVGKCVLQVTSTQVTICGKQVTTIGARDTHNDHLVTPGYDVTIDG